MNFNEINKEKKIYIEHFSQMRKSNEKLKELSLARVNDIETLQNNIRKYIEEITGETGKPVSIYHFSFNSNNCDENVINSLSKIEQCIELYNKIENFYNNSYNIVKNKTEKAIKDLNSSFWFLKSKKSKEALVENVEFLEKAFQSGFCQKIDELENEWINYYSIGNLLEFKANPSKHVEYLNQLCNTNFYIEEDPSIPNVAEFEKEIEKFSEKLSRMDNVEDIVNNTKEIIKNKTMDLLNSKNKDLLKSVEVSQLKTIIPELRTGVLENAGYNTVADVLKVSEWKLANIKGISEDNARDIMKAAQTLKERSLTNFSLRINSSKMSEKEKDLIRHVQKIKHYEPILAEYKKISFVKPQQLSQNINAKDWYYQTYQNKMAIVNRFEENRKTLKDNDEEISRLIKKLKIVPSTPSDYFKNNSTTIYSTLEELVPGLFKAEDELYGLPEDLARRIQEECIFPDGLLVNLRNYQTWGVKYILHQKNVLLGDEMGLGKTIQAIAAMVSLKNIGATHFLVICPAAVLYNWYNEILKHSRLMAYIVHGNYYKNNFKQWTKNGGVAITTYEGLSKFKLPEDFRMTLMVVDEAHYVKNSSAKRTKNVINIGKHCDRKLYMTGTALENNVDEMIALIRQLNEKVANKLEPYKALVASEQFRHQVIEVYYRRKVKDVQKELPDLIQKDILVNLENEEYTKYREDVLSRSFAEIRKNSWNVELDKSSKTQALKLIVEQVKSENKKMIIFSFFLDTIKKIQEYFKDDCTNLINGSVAPQERQRIIDEFAKNDKTILIAQINAGGTGLNIQSASTVVICEPQFKPSVENQAIKRAHRMGQTETVFVYRLLASNSIDMKMKEVLKQKQEIFNAFADRSVAADATNQNEISTKGFAQIVEEEIERIKNEEK